MTIWVKGTDDDAHTLDRKRITHLAAEIMRAVRDNYAAGPESSDRVFEALNALAFVAAVVVKGTGDDARAMHFFHQAMMQQTAGLQRDDERSAD